MPCGREKTYPFSTAYLDTIHKFYAPAGRSPSDFKHNAEGERQKINAWVEQQTNQRIKRPDAARLPRCLTRLVLTNAIYFKGEWAEPFAQGTTKEEDFLAAGGRKSACR